MDRLRKLLEKAKKVIVCVDANAHSDRWGIGGVGGKVNKRRRGIGMFLDEVDLHVCNTRQKHGTYIDSRGRETCIDITLASGDGIDRVRKWKCKKETFISDHRLIECEYLINRGRVKYGGGRSESRRIAIVHTISEEMRKKLINGVKHKEEAKTRRKLDYMIRNHVNEIHRSIRIQREGEKREGRKEKEWWNKEIAEKYRELKKARRRAERYKYEGVRLEFRNQRREFRRMIKKEKFRSWKEFVTNVQDPWAVLMKILRSTDRGKAKAKTLEMSDGKYTGNSLEMINELKGNFFLEGSRLSRRQQEVEKEVKRYLERNRDFQLREEEGISIQEVWAMMEEIRKKSASGEDGITNAIIKCLVKDCGLAGIYVNLFIFNLRLGYVPKKWKRVKIVLIPKARTELDTAKSLRPISLTTIEGKLIERIVIQRIVEAIEISGKITVRQHAYRKEGSTYTALYEMVKYIQEVKREGNISVVVFLDISGAFDRAWHVGILKGLISMGVPAYLIKWVVSYLKDRVAEMELGVEKVEFKLRNGCP